MAGRKNRHLGYLRVVFFLCLKKISFVCIKVLQGFVKCV